MEKLGALDKEVDMCFVTVALATEMLMMVVIMNSYWTVQSKNIVNCDPGVTSFI